jgi:hypothetical protein
MSRHPNKQRDALLQHLLEHKPPGGENYFVFSIVSDAAEPTWDMRQTFAGTYEQAAALCVAALGVMAAAGDLKKGAQIEMYQGPAARRYIAEAMVQESRYRRERQGEANN